MTQIGETLALAQLSHSNTHSFGRGMCLLSLDSSLVLHAVITATSSSETSILLWDMRYGVVIASHAIPIPPTIAPSIKQGINMSLLLADAGQVLLTLCPANTSRTASKLSQPPSYAALPIYTCRLCRSLLRSREYSASSPQSFLAPHASSLAMSKIGLRWRRIRIM
ncbi:hypothetical protein BDR06DRAFT_376574 [Suillus hirtellus]|nr:hypothetical protein BDR06DRAFT_376574 [Suillus hirtellus]